MEVEASLITHLIIIKRRQPQFLIRAMLVERTLILCRLITLLAQQRPTMCQPLGSSRPLLTFTRSPSSKSNRSMHFIKRISTIILKNLPSISHSNRSNSFNSSKCWCAKNNSVSMSNRLQSWEILLWCYSSSIITVELIQQRLLAGKIIQGQDHLRQAQAAAIWLLLRKTNKGIKWCTLRIYPEEEM